MESITPHYTSLGVLKFPDIVKLNTCMLFYELLKSFLIYLFHRYLNYIITVPAVHHPIKLQYLYFELILADFAPALLEVSFRTIFRNPLETNHLKKCLKKHFYTGTWLNTNESISLLQLSELFCHFSFTFLLIILSPLLYITLRGTILVYLDVPLSSPSNIQCNSI